MGEEEKKPAAGEEKQGEDKKLEQEKKKEAKEEAKAEDKPAAEEKKGEESKEGKESKEESPPPREIVLKVYMHCEGCARKVRRSLKGFDGVEDVITDCKTSKVVVKGEKADPLKVAERVQRKSHKQVQLISPIPKPPTEEEKAAAAEKKEKPKPEEKKEEPQVITVVLKVNMHCEACAMKIKKRILGMEGVESAEPDLNSSQVTVKGVFDPPKLVDYLYKRTSKQAVIVKQEPEKKEEGEKGKESKEEKKEGEEGGDKEKKGGDGEQGENKQKKEGEEEAKPGDGKTEGTTVVDFRKNEYSYPPRYPPLELLYYDPYTLQIFSDENPNACTVM